MLFPNAAYVSAHRIKQEESCDAVFNWPKKSTTKLALNAESGLQFA